MTSQEHLDLAAMVEEVTVPCDAARHAGDQAATWVVWQRVCCDKRPEIGLLCTPCLHRYTQSARPVVCRDCGTRTPMARLVIVRYQPIDITIPPTEAAGS